VRRLAGILADGGLGEVASIRVQAVLGDAGKPPSAALPASGWPRHDAFDHGLLLALLGGPITRATAYLGTMTARGGAGLAACAFRDPGRYGVLELVHAPGLRIESDHAPHDLQVEVAGTDGVAWLRRGAGRRTMQPALEVRAGRDWVSMGSGTGLDDDWAAAWEIAARDGLDWIRGRAVPVPGLDLVRGALALRDRMAEASERAEVIEL
jgi:predicted dehydrogenase